MTIDVYTAKNTHIAVAQGDDLTAWDNAQAALVSGECNPTDQFLGGTNFLPHDTTERFSSLAATRIPDRKSTGRIYGVFVGNFAFQTAQFIWWLQQACTTAGAGAPYTHTITTTTSNNPKYFGIHVEHESTSNSRRRDLLGIIPKQLVIYGSSKPGPDWKFKQTLSCDYAYCNSAAADIAAQTKRSATTEGTKWKPWSSICESDGTGLGGHAMDVFTYNTNALEIAVNSVTITLTNTGEFIGYDNAGYYRDAVLHTFDYSIDLGFIAKGDNLLALSYTDWASYAGDLDLTLKFTSHADNDEITMAFDKLYAVPFGEEAVRYDKHREEYTVHFEPYSSSSSLATTGEDSLTEGDYENTA